MTVIRYAKIPMAELGESYGDSGPSNTAYLLAVHPEDAHLVRGYMDVLGSCFESIRHNYALPEWVEDERDLNTLAEEGYDTNEIREAMRVVQETNYVKATIVKIYNQPLEKIRSWQPLPYMPYTRRTDDSV